MIRRLAPALLALAALPAGLGFASERTWHPDLEAGIAAARKSGKPILVVTAWTKGVCSSCDDWRSRVGGDADLQQAFDRFEAVEWLYDGLGGKVIRWTKSHGSTHDDPSVLVFVAGTDGSVIAKSETAYQPAGLRKWLEEQADAYERAHPATRVPFVRATVVAEGDGDARAAACAELDDARAAGRPVLLYVGRSARPADDKAAKAVVKASQKFEKGVLASKSAAEAAEGILLLRLDVSDPDHALLARSLGVDEAPTLLLFAPASAAAEELGARITGASLAHRLKAVPRARDAADEPEDDGAE